MDKDKVNIEIMLAQRVKDLGENLGHWELRQIGETMKSLMGGDRKFLESNKENFYRQLRKAGYNHETLKEIGLFKGIDPKDYNPK